MPACPWSPSPSGEDLAFSCPTDVLCLCLPLLPIALHCRVYTSMWACESYWDRRTQWHGGEKDYLCVCVSLSLSRSYTHTLSVLSPSGELSANSRLVRPLLTPCLSCETKSNYKATVLSSFTYSITPVIKLQQGIPFNVSQTKWPANFLGSRD